MGTHTPVFDFDCPACNVRSEHYVPTYDVHKDCPDCGGPLTRVYVNCPTIIPDSIPGGRVIENLTPQPKRYYSRTEIRDEMRARGVESHVRHVGQPGSDKSPHTKRWI